MPSDPAIRRPNMDLPLDDVEQQLCAQVVAQDASALGLLLQRWRPWLIGRVRRSLGPSQPAGRRPSDVVQEACVLALRFLPDFRGDNRHELRAWIASILQTAIMQTQRHSRAMKRADRQTIDMDEQQLELPTPRLSQLVSNRQGYRDVVAEITRLPKRQREVLYLRLLEERTLDEIATQLAESEQAVASLLKRGLATLRVRLDPHTPRIKRRAAGDLDAALQDYLRRSDRGLNPSPRAFLTEYAALASDLAPLLDWLHTVRLRLTESESR